MNRTHTVSAVLPSSRRRFLRRTLGLGMASLATGLPAWFFTRAGRLRAQVDPAPPSFLILSVCESGDPLNANCPGSYVSGVINNPNENMTRTPVAIGTQMFDAALPWSTALTPALRERMCVIHHRTDTVAHTDLPSLLELHGALRGPESNGKETLPSAFSQELFAALDPYLPSATIPNELVQIEPLGVGREVTTFESRPLESLSPSDLLGLFASPERVSMLASPRFQELREQALDAIYREAADKPAQMRFIERYARSRDEARNIGASLGDMLSGLPLDEEPDGPRDQALTAAALLRLGITPVVMIHVPFGGDNHADPGLLREADETVTGLGALQFLFDQLGEIRDQTTIATLNTFGRTLARAGDGRGHNGQHHAMVVIGPRVAPGVYGGVEPVGDDFGATSIDSVTGAAGGDIAASDTLVAAAATLAKLVGMPDERIAARIPDAPFIQAAVRA